MESDSSLTLDGVTVTNGKEDDGGGIYAESFSDLTVENSTITENLATEDGGAIYGEFLSDIVVKGSTITENVAENDGGAIYAEDGAHVLVQESKITKNRAHENGGGIYGERDAVVVVDKSTLAEDEAKDEGGGIDAYISERLCEVAAGHTKRSSKVRPTTAGEESEPNLTVDQSSIEHNSAAYGGGIAIYQEEGGCPSASSKAAVKPQSSLFLEPNISIDKSTIAYNRAEERFDEGGGYGGGIYEEGRIVDPITNTTIADNFATNDGGGAVIADGASAALISDTVFDNTVEPEEIAIQGHSARRAIHRDVVEGGVGPGNNLATEVGNAYVALRNTIVAEPSASIENCEGNFESLVAKAGYNLDYPSKALTESTVDSCGMSAEEHDLLNEPPGLNEKEGLASNGGPTQTIALLSSSPAIGFVPVAGDCEESENGPASVDQRGEPRPGIPGRGCDIGAYEYQEPPKVAAPTKEEPKKEAAASVLSIKIVSPPECASKRDITIHIQNVKQLGIVSAVVSIDGQHKRTLSGRHLSTGIDLVGLPKGTFTIEIVARTRSGHKLKGERVYHTCHTKLPGHSYLKL